MITHRESLPTVLCLGAVSVLTASAITAIPVNDKPQEPNSYEVIGEVFKRLWEDEHPCHKISLVTVTKGLSEDNKRVISFLVYYRRTKKHPKGEDGSASFDFQITLTDKWKENIEVKMLFRDTTLQQDCKRK